MFAEYENSKDAICINCGGVILNPEYVKFKYCSNDKCQEAYLKRTRRINKEVNTKARQSSRVSDTGSRLTDRLDNENDDFRLANWSRALNIGK